MSKNLAKKLAILHDHYPVLRTKYAVKRIGIFGSVARGTERRGSDVDVLVELTKPISLFVFFDLEHYLKQVLKQPVDLVTKKALKSTIKKEILRDTVYV